MTSSLPSPETGNQVGDVDTPCPRALFKEVGHDIGERMRVCGLGDTVPGEWGRQVVPLVIDPASFTSPSSGRSVPLCCPHFLHC